MNKETFLGVKKYIHTENIVNVIFFVFIASRPFVFTAYQMENYANFFVMVILALSLTMIWGYCGIFSFGQAVFYGIGSYAYSIVSKASGIPLLGAFSAIALGALFAAIIGYFMFYGKMNDVFTGIVTLCIASLFEEFMNQTSGAGWKLLGIKLGGYNGINNVPALSIGSFKFTGLAYYVLVSLSLLAVFIFLKVLAKRKLGYAMFSVRENKERSELLGYHTAKIQTLAFTLGGAIAGYAGCLFSSGMNYTTPSLFSMVTSTLVLVTVSVGGKKNPSAVMIITFIYLLISQQLAISGNNYTNIIIGVSLMIVMLLMPNGILATVYELCDRGLSALFGLRSRKIGKETRLPHEQ